MSEIQPSKPLTTKQRSFVSHYLGDAQLNGTLAAQRAGYTPDDPHAASVAACRLLKLPKIREAIEAKLDESAATAAEILSRLTSIAMGDVAAVHECFLYDDKGRKVVDWEKIRARNLQHLVSEVQMTKHGEVARTHSVMKALELLGKFRSLFVDRIEIGVNWDDVDMESISEADLLAISKGKVSLSDLVASGRVQRNRDRGLPAPETIDVESEVIPQSR